MVLLLGVVSVLIVALVLVVVIGCWRQLLSSVVFVFLVIVVGC